MLKKSNVAHEMRVICEKPLDVGPRGHFIPAHLHLHDDIRGTSDGNPEEP
jgi:hypothetical protein